MVNRLFREEVYTLDKEFEQRLADLKEKYCELPSEKKAEIERHIKKKNFLNYKKIELIKKDLLRLEAKRAQLELCDRNKERNQVEEKIRLKKEKLLKCITKQIE
ncbi:hypothetical protein [Enterococcus rivorum]|uniref:hypothetical protein n=1 Tax=Enterococcus rivorum TaxID=762845 RepID=UPI0009FDA09A|nr:hypothetical protein [Enterococcus rivorum]